MGDRRKKKEGEGTERKGRNDSKQAASGSRCKDKSAKRVQKDKSIRRRRQEKGRKGQEERKSQERIRPRDHWSSPRNSREHQSNRVHGLADGREKKRGGEARQSPVSTPIPRLVKITGGERKMITKGVSRTPLSTHSATEEAGGTRHGDSPAE